MNAFFKLMLKGSAVSAFALTMAAVGCSDSDKDKDTTPAGGDSGGGKAGSASEAGSDNKGGDPSTDGGTAAGGVDAGGAGGAAAGISVAKFCNDLTFGTEESSEDTTFILEIGTGADKVTFTAATGVCAPADGNACKSIPIGAAVPVALFDSLDLETAIFEGSIDSADGDNWIFNTDLSDDQEPSPIAVGRAVTQIACKDVTYSDVYPTGGDAGGAGAGGAGGAGGATQ